jgi:hypothetical protein
MTLDDSSPPPRRPVESKPQPLQGVGGSTLLLHSCLLHCCYILVTLLLHCCYTDVALLLHCCYTQQLGGMVKKGALRLPAVILSTILNLMLCVPFGLSIFPADWVRMFLSVCVVYVCVRVCVCVCVYMCAVFVCVRVCVCVCETRHVNNM